MHVLQNNKTNPMSSKSLEEVYGTIDTTGNISWRRRFMLFIGPAFMVSVGYMDPGNWATDIAGGSQYGYKLIWVLLMSNFIALMLQSLCARLGIVSGKDLAQASRETYPRYVNYALYGLAEIAIAACDLAEVLGMAIGLKLLFGFPLLWGVAIGALDTFFILFLQQKGIRYMEILIFSMVFIIGSAFMVELFFAKPVMHDLALGFIPSIPDTNALYIAIGIIGATVMPHNLYLHSALVQTRRNGTDKKSIRRAIKFSFFDSAIALNLAFFVNAAILIVSAAVFYKNGFTEVASIENAHALLEPLMGERLAPTLFAIALIAAGQSSTITGTLAGQIVMEGYLNLRIAPWLRRLLTRSLAIIPAVIFLVIYGESKTDELLILSQVILSLQLGFAVVPLIHFVSDKKRMREFAIGNVLKFFSWIAVSLIIFLNLKLVTDMAVNTSLAALWLTIIGCFIALLFYIIIYPLLQSSKEKIVVHEMDKVDTPVIETVHYHNIGICVDFSSTDKNAILKGFALGTKHCNFFIIHAVESAAARATGLESRDYETLSDWKLLNDYCANLKDQGYNTIPLIGFGDAKKVIPELANENKLDILVLGAHGHEGIKDIIFGETISSVRHKVNCPVLIV
jgi:manganese transport protein